MSYSIILLWLVQGINSTEFVVVSCMVSYCMQTPSCLKSHPLRDVCIVPEFAFCCGDQTLAKSNLVEERFWVACKLLSTIKGVKGGTQLRNLEAGAKAENMEKNCLLVSFSGLLSYFLT